MSNILKLFNYAAKPNIAKELSESDLNTIASDVWEGYEIDENSRTEWWKQNQEAMKLAKQIKEPKSFPWQNAANVKYPLITTAALQFNARAYPEIVQSHEIVKARVIGADPEGFKHERANRVSSHMSYQLSEEMEEWEEETDRLLIVLPILGMYYRKTYFCPIKKRNVSETHSPEYVVVHNKARNLETARRVSHRVYLYENDIYEAQQKGLWLNVDLGQPDDEEERNDDDGRFEFIEQHCFIDLDDDGYKEPYIATIHKQTKKIVRIKARYKSTGIEYGPKIGGTGTVIKRIEPVHYFTKFSFMPDPEGNYHDIGFGILLEPINEAVNTLTNELLDAGGLANAGGGFIAKGIRLKQSGQSGPIKFELGEWKVVETSIPDLRAGLMPLPVRDPSQVLYLLLGTLIDAGRDISSVKDVLTGEKPGENVSATTVLALVEQGLKVFSAIYKRIYRSLTKEFKKLFVLNAENLNPRQYFTVLDEPMEILQSDYNQKDLDIKPVADPHIVSNAQKLALAQALMAVSGRPGVNEYELTKIYVDAIGHGYKNRMLYNEEKWAEIQQQQQQPDPEIVDKLARLDMDKEMFPLEIEEKKAKIEQILATANKTEADTILSEMKALYEKVKPLLESQKIDVQRDAIESKEDNTKE
jgi:chaperonin GroES